MKFFSALILLITLSITSYAQETAPCTSIDLSPHILNIGSTCHFNPTYEIALCNLHYCDLPAGAEIAVGWRYCENGVMKNKWTFITAPAIPAGTCPVITGVLPSSSLCADAIMAVVADPLDNINETNESNNYAEQIAPMCP